MRFGVIYKVIVGNTFIIGSTLNKNKRKSYYLNILRKNKWNNTYLQNSWNKYGESSFVFEVLQENIPENILEHVEDIWIGALCSRAEDKRKGANMRDACRVRFSQNTKNKMSKAKIGKKLSEVQKEVLYQTAVLKSIEKTSKKVYRYTLEGVYIDSYNSVHEAATKFNIGFSNIAYSARSNGINMCCGFLWSYIKNEKIPKYSIIQSEKLRTPIQQFDLQGNFIKEWESIASAAKTLKISGGNINMCLSGKKDKTNGFKWKNINKN